MPDLVFEQQLRAEGHRVIAGIDEAGRGPLAGPVVAAAVVLPEGYRNGELNDSKQLSSKKREALYGEIVSDTEIAWSFAVVESDEIDRINILQATYAAMRRAARGLGPGVDAALIDGRPVPGFPLHHLPLVKGDSLSLSIAAASVIAKVERDRLMIDYAEKWPEYGFERHKGYGTRDHLKALNECGPCPIHRRSFEPVAQLRFDF